VKGSRCRVQDLESHLEFVVQGLGFMVQDFGFGVQDFGFGVQDLGFGVQGSGSRNWSQGSEFREEGVWCGEVGIGCLEGGWGGCGGAAGRVLISQKVITKSFCKCQFPHKLVNLFFILVMIKDQLTDLCGDLPLQNDFMNTFCEISSWCAGRAVRAWCVSGNRYNADGGRWNLAPGLDSGGRGGGHVGTASIFSRR